MAQSSTEHAAEPQRTYGQWWQHNEDFVAVSIDSIRRFGIAAYTSAGATPEDAAFLVSLNMDKSLQGDHTRGVGRIAGNVLAARAGKLDVHPALKVTRESASFSLVDCEANASGPLACKLGMELAIKKARATGIAFSGVRAQAQLLTRFLQLATAADMVGIVFNQSFPTVAPTGGAGPMLGNQPLAIGVPTSRHDPVLLDMSMTQSSAAGMFLAATQGQQVAPGLLLDQHGMPTTDARDFPTEHVFPGLGPGARGSLTPLGDNHKGYAMVFILSLLSAVLSDTSPPWELFYHLQERGRYGTVLIAIDPAVVMPVEQFKSRVDDFIDNVKAAKPRDGVKEILYPGEGSQRLRREREQSGVVPLPASQYAALCQLAQELGVQPPQKA